MRLARRHGPARRRAAKATIGAAEDALDERARAAAAGRAALSRRASATSSSSTTRRWPTRPPRRRSCRRATASPPRARSSSPPWDEHDARRPHRAAGSPPHCDGRPSTAPSTRGSWTTRIVLLALLAAAVGGALRARAHPLTGPPPPRPPRRRARRRTAWCPSSRPRSRSATCPCGSRASGSVSAFYTVTVKTQVDGRIDRVRVHRGAARQEGRPARPDRPAPVRHPARDRAGRARARRRQRARTRSSTPTATRRSASRTSSPSSSTPTSRRCVDQLDAQVAVRPGGDRLGQAEPRLRAHHVAHRRRDRRPPGRPRQRRARGRHDGHRRRHAARPHRGLLHAAARTTCPPSPRRMAAGAAAGRGVQPRRRRARSARASSRVIDNQINQATATIRLKAIFDNPKHAALAQPVRQGAAARCRRARARIVVPAAVVQHGPQGHLRLRRRAPTRRPRCGPSTVDAIQGDIAIIASGLAAGEQVVVDGQASSARARRCADARRPAPRAERAPRRRPRAGGAPDGRRGGPGGAMSGEHLRAVHPAAGRDDAADGRPAARRAWSAFKQLPVSALPQVDYPTIVVSTHPARRAAPTRWPRR